VLRKWLRAWRGKGTERQSFSLYHQDTHLTELAQLTDLVYRCQLILLDVAQALDAMRRQETRHGADPARLARETAAIARGEI
jgi:hypothetical protein